ncbi:hypothetical protein CEXT_701781 [Caerostris extrusa]|uniref:Uncharacterized protein n=1 Tax=Caerostris extrusa TaxID=172846 RepID=A0AAV4Y414_CAEEX|nr:hypothetical protein CEXT_701781 [Caerostris extrusa]
MKSNDEKWLRTTILIVEQEKDDDLKTMWVYRCLLYVSREDEPNKPCDKCYHLDGYQKMEKLARQLMKQKLEYHFCGDLLIQMGTYLLRETHQSRKSQFLMHMIIEPLFKVEDEPNKPCDKCYHLDGYPENREARAATDETKAGIPLLP